MIPTCAICVSVVCSAMKSGLSSARRKRTYSRARERVGATCGRGRRLMPTPSCASRTTWAIAASIRRTNSCRMRRPHRWPSADHHRRAQPYLQAVEDASERKSTTRSCTRFTALRPRRIALQPRNLHRLHMKTVWRPDPNHISTSLRGAPEPHDAHVDAPLHAADKRIQQEAGEPRPRGRAVLHALQLLPRPQGRCGLRLRWKRLTIMSGVEELGGIA